MKGVALKWVDEDGSLKYLNLSGFYNLTGFVILTLNQYL